MGIEDGMKIDKKRFLFLTTSIAAAATTALVVSATGCNTVHTEDDAGSSSGSTPTADSGSNEDTGAGDGGSSSDADAAVACLGNTGAAPLCGPANEGEDAGGLAKCSLECDHHNATFKTEVAKAISDCLDVAFDGPTFEGCASAEAPCVEAALAKACDDPEADAYCTTLLAGCGDAGTTVTQEQCVAVVRALSTEGKTTLTTCTAEGTCGDCLDQLKATPL